MPVLSSTDTWHMRRAAWITLGLLGGGITLIAVEGERAHARRCEQARRSGVAASEADCRSPDGSIGHVGGSAGGGNGRGSTDDAAHGSVVRGGFGAVGEGFGGGSAGE